MRIQKKKESVRHGPRQREVQRFVKLLLEFVVVSLLFWVAVMYGPLWLVILGVYSAVAIAVGVPARIDVNGWGLVILATVLVVPLYGLRKNIERRLDEVRYQLEQVGAPESSEAPDTSSDE